MNVDAVKLTVRLFLSIASVLILLVSLEVSMRVYQMRLNKEILNLNKPINSDGFRDYEYKKKTKRKRIIAVGDSFTYGSGVKFTDSWPKKLEKNLGRNYEVLNFGIPSTHTIDQLKTIKEKAIKYSPDVIILGVMVNDVDDIANKINKNKNKGIIEKLKGKSNLCRYLSPRIGSLLRGVGIDPGKLSGFSKINDMYITDSKEYLLFEKAIIEIKKTLERHGIEFKVVILPYISDFDKSYPLYGVHKKISDICKENQIDYIDLLPSFKGINPKELHVSILDQHPNKKGHMIIAEALSEWSKLR